jgi:hypothetical protein
MLAAVGLTLILLGVLAPAVDVMSATIPFDFGVWSTRS